MNTETRIDQPVLELTSDLIKRPSVSPHDEGCQDILAARLEKLGFDLEFIDKNDVRNLWAVYQADSQSGNAGPHLLFAGHTDVVPPGPLDEWRTSPFEPRIENGKLYGRGAADMKLSLAAMIVAVEELITSDTPLEGTLSFLITSDEEADAIDGTRHAVTVLAERGIRPDFCIVGEPSSSETVGDVVRCGRRGSMNAKLVFTGIQGHVAYPDDADNPVHGALEVLSELTSYRWDEGNAYYPPSSLQVSNVRAGTGASNVIPGTLEVDFNIRFNTEQTPDEIKRIISEMLDRSGRAWSIDWSLSGLPFLTQESAFTDTVCRAIEKETGKLPELSTSGGTSDGRFIHPWAGDTPVEVVELGPCNATIHKVNECVPVDDAAPLTRIYLEIAANLLSPSGSP